MSCNNKLHNHQWITEGELIIERCEHVCRFCPGDKAFEHAWFLRRHVTQVHCGKSHPNLKVIKGWTGKLEGNAKPHSAESAARRYKKLKARKKTQTVTPPPESRLVHTYGVQPTVNPAALTQPNFNVEQVTAPVAQPGNASLDLPSNSCDDFPSHDALGSLPYPFLEMMTSEFFALDTNEHGAATTLPDNLFPDNAFIENSFANNSFTGDCINPSMIVSTPVVKKRKRWAIPQSIRIDNTTIVADCPTSPLDGTPERLTQAIDTIVSMINENTTMSQQQILGTIMAYADAFKNGRKD